MVSSPCPEILSSNSEMVGDVARLLSVSGGASWLFLIGCSRDGFSSRGGLLLRLGVSSERIFRCAVSFLLRPIDYSDVPHMAMRDPRPIRGRICHFLGHRLPHLAYSLMRFHIWGPGLHSESAYMLLHHLVEVRHCSEEAFLCLSGLSMGGLVLVRCLLFHRHGCCSFPPRDSQKLVSGLACHYIIKGKGGVNLKKGRIHEMHGPE